MIKEKKHTGPKSPTGLHIMKNGKLKFPFARREHDFRSEHKFDAYGFPLCKVGDLVTNNPILSAGVIGKVTFLRMDHLDSSGKYPPLLSATFVSMAGKTESSWAYNLTVISDEQVKEVIEYYHNVGRPERVVVDILENNVNELRAMKCPTMFGMDSEEYYQSFYKGK